MRASTIVILIVIFVTAFGGIVGMGLYMRANDEQAKQEITPADQIKPSLAVAVQKGDAPKATAVETPKPQPVVRIEKVNAELAKPLPIKIAEKPVEKPKVEPVGQPVSIVKKDPPAVLKMPREAKELVLLAADAVMHGKGLRKLPTGEIAGLAASDTLDWMIEPAQSGTYTIEVTYSCGDDAGGICLISAGPRVFTQTIRSTGGWDRFITVELGKLSMASRPVRLRVLPTVCREDGVMTIRSVRIAKR